MQSNKITFWHFVVPALMVACLSLIVVCYINESTNERLLLTSEILIRRNHLLDSLFKASDREDDSLRNRCDSLERRNIFFGGERASDSAVYLNFVGGTLVQNPKDSSFTWVRDTVIKHRGPKSL